MITLVWVYRILKYSKYRILKLEIVSKFIGYEVLQSVAFLHINKQKKGDLKITVRLKYGGC